MLQWVRLYLSWPLNPHSVSASKPVIGREEGRALLILVKYDSAPQRARARQAGARGSVMRSLRGELPRMPGSTALCTYESWHACNRGNATSGRGLIEVYVTLIGLYFECLASGPHRLKYSRDNPPCVERRLLGWCSACICMFCMIRILTDVSAHIFHRQVCER